MKRAYIQPETCILYMETSRMLASSNEVRVTVSEEEYDGEARVKGYEKPVDWNEIWN